MNDPSSVPIDPITTDAIFVVNGGDSSITVIDATTDAVSGARLSELATGSGAHAFVFSADGAKAYVTNQTAGTITVVELATRTAVKAIPVGAQPNGIVFRAR